MDKRIGFALYQSCGNSGSIVCVSVLRWCMWGVGLNEGLEEWGGVMLLLFAFRNLWTYFSDLFTELPVPPQAAGVVGTF